jgi:UDP:flavonoid glycosyltransferase YjiC (YdhE family)
MATYLLCSTPLAGYLAPMLRIARHLKARSHRVILLSGSRFEGEADASGIEFRALDGLADFDDRDPESYRHRSAEHHGFASHQQDIEATFVRTIPDQFRALEAVIAELAPDAVLADNAFGGVVPLLTTEEKSTDTRPPILGIGVTPVTHSGAGAAPYGMGLPPASNTLERVRNQALNIAADKVILHQTKEAARQVFEELGIPAPTEAETDFSMRFDRLLQLSIPEFEYPREEPADNIHFVGPILAPSVFSADRPDWWPDLAGRRVVYVTQGTVDNTDFGRLVLPTIEALADADVLVVVTTGGRPVGELGELPDNVRAAEFLSLDLLLQATDVMVTNGGYGSVQYALSHGVPLIAAGDTGDKPEIAARIEWSGVGINLRTGNPTPRAISAAVTAVLGNDRYRKRASELAHEIGRHHPLEAIEDELREAIAAARH